VIAGTVIVLGLVAWIISIVATVLTYGGFELRRSGDQLVLQYGVLDRRRVTVPIRRLQAIRVVETLMRQPFGLAEVAFDLAGMGAEQGGRGVLCPLLPKREVAALLAAAAPDFATELEPAGLRRLPGRARRRYVFAATVGWVITIVVAAVIAWRFLDVSAGWVLLALLATPVFALFGNLRYRDAGWLAEDGHILLRWRAVARVTVVTQVRRLQFRELTADPLQRRANLVTFRTAVASGGAREGFSLPHLDRGEAEALVQALGGAGRRRRGIHPAPPAGARAGTAGTG
jgi:putative membrane protein